MLVLWIVVFLQYHLDMSFVSTCCGIWDHVTYCVTLIVNDWLCEHSWRTLIYTLAWRLRPHMQIETPHADLDPQYMNVHNTL